MSRFSIVIPARNGERYLEAAIQSALAQTRAADEILVVDDASVDRTSEIARSARWNGRVSYRYHASPSGFALAWNRAAQFCNGDFVTILHQDDLLDSQYLASVESARIRFPNAEHIYAACRYIDAYDTETRCAPLPHSDAPELLEGKDYARRYLDGVLSNRHIHRCPGVTTSRLLLTTRCAYRKEAGHIADDDFFYRVGALTNVIGIAKPLASYREHEQSITGSNESLELTLAGDWLFQVREFKAGRTLFQPSDGVRLVKQTVKLATRALVSAIRKQDDAKIRASVRIMETLEQTAPECHAHVARWATASSAFARPRG